MFTNILLDIQENWLLYCAMPLVAAAIGYITKLLAIKMMFSPIKFIGIKPYLGWQGIVPRKAEYMANIACETLTKNLINPQEIWERLDHRVLLSELEKPLSKAVESMTEEIVSTYYPSLWQVLPKTVKTKLTLRVQQQVPTLSHRIVTELGENLETVFDLKDMIVKALTTDKRVIIKIFKETGREEFAFIRRTGIYFGFIIGVVQAITWALTHSPWVMPLFGSFVGFFSDWLALKMIFRPLEEKKFFGVWSWQGLFLKRRLEVCEIHAQLIAEEVLTVPNLVDAIISGPASDRLFNLVHRYIEEMIDEQAGYLRPVLVYSMGSQNYIEMKKQITQKMIGQLPAMTQHIEPLLASQLDIKNELSSKMKLMTLEQFEGLLRPVFQQDEKILIILGGILGFLVGELQVYIMLHH